MHVFILANGYSNSPRVHLYEGLNEVGHFGVGQHGVAEGPEGGFMIEVDTDEHEFGAWRNTIGCPQGGWDDLQVGAGLLPSVSYAQIGINPAKPFERTRPVLSRKALSRRSRLKGRSARKTTEEMPYSSVSGVCGFASSSA
ncbi:Uncharacterised protein [Corynebacterium minutissimum]|uniref:Uncharacterized protein n=1 Tax=Corynebacterium minutissimum TaxID=38301 RepID=A0A376CTU3_9CORY|nr:Uncharacterised protein [Corynebacterium minutissimum]